MKGSAGVMLTSVATTKHCAAWHTPNQATPEEAHACVVLTSVAIDNALGAWHASQKPSPHASIGMRRAAHALQQMLCAGMQSVCA